MLRVIALVATVATAGILTGTASAHPPDINSVYSQPTYTQPIYTQPTYSQPTYTRPTYSQPTYSQPTYTQPTYSQPVYSQPSYSGVTYGTSTYNATPLYSKTYATPSYRAPRYTYSGYRQPSYGYRHVRNPYHTRPVNNYVRQSFGPYSRVPTTEGLNVGYAGGPTYGSDQNPVINGVSLNAAPN